MKQFIISVKSLNFIWGNLANKEFMRIENFFLHLLLVQRKHIPDVILELSI